MRERIAAVFARVFREMAEGEPPQLTEETVLLNTGLDSLGFAVLIARLEEEVGFDPFAASAEAYYPRTFGDLADFYERNRPR